MTPREFAFLVAGGLATLAALTIVAAGVIGAVIITLRLTAQLLGVLP